MGANLQEMKHLASFVGRGTQVLATEAMVLTQRGFVRPFGSSPGTPVDTGQHRSSATTAAGSAPTFRPPNDAPAYPVYGENQVRASLDGAPLGTSLYLAQNAPAAALLGVAPGLSKQAPQGYVNQAIETAATKIKDVRIEE